MNGFPDDRLAGLRDELEESHRRLAEAHKMAALGRLSAGIVHEINSPIGSILSNNETVARSLTKLRDRLIEARDKGEAPSEQTIQMLTGLIALTEVDRLACERIGAIVRSFKTFARVNESDLRKVDLNSLVRDTLKLSSAVYRRRVTFEFEPGHLPEVECFPGLLSQVLLNLVTNAAQAIRDEGTVRVTTDLDGGCAHIAVQDNGTGIPPEVRPKIFAAGFTTKPIGEGTGLGLTITREIVEDTHRGSISFETEVGKGTTFHVRVPIEQPRNRSNTLDQ